MLIESCQLQKLESTPDHGQNPSPPMARRQQPDRKPATQSFDDGIK
jgi:hypothetical protein